MIDVKGMANKVAPLVAAAALLAGCGKSPEPTPEKDPFSKATLPVAPALTANPAIVKLFADPSIPAEVKQSLMNPHVHSILSEIWASSARSEGLTYVRNEHDPAVGIATVKVLQYLLNNASAEAVKTAENHIAKLTKEAKDTPRLKLADSKNAHWLERHKEESLATAARMERMLAARPKELALDGDFGKDSHRVRIFVTQIANTTANFPHIKGDVGSNDTAIGPRTLNLLTKTQPEFRDYFASDFADVVVSAQKVREQGAEKK